MTFHLSDPRIPDSSRHFVLRGPVPSKKNKWRIRANSSIGITDEKVLQEIESLILQARIAWGYQPPMAYFQVVFGLVVKSAGTDLDNKLGCLMDVLQKARVIQNDNVNRCKSILIFGEIGTEEETHVWLVEVDAKECAA